MQRPHKFVPGEKITKVEDAVEVILMGLYIYENHKPQHPGWMMSQPLSLIASSARSGKLRYAVLNDEHPDNFKEVAEP
jgi:hypothetical protein